jgi:hypothetical protein
MDALPIIERLQQEVRPLTKEDLPQASSIFSFGFNKGLP